jgi:copper(I)-binding protein
MTGFRSAAMAALLLIISPALAYAHHDVMHDGCPAGQSFTSGDITVTGAYTRATLPGAKSAGGFLSIVNSGTTADRLTGGASEAARLVEVHEMKMVGDVMEMARVEGGLEIPAGGSVDLVPGGFHVMMMGMEQAFEEGECILVTLHFEKAGDLEIMLNVGGVGQDAPVMGHDMDGMSSMQ